MIGAVDIGGTKIAVGVVNSDGRLLARRECPTDADGGYSAALDRIVSMLREVQDSARAKITGIGIGSTGPVYPLTGEIGDVNFFPGWRGKNPVQDLQRVFGLSVAMENDADAAALAEFTWGAGRGKSRFIYVTVGTGIGVAIVVDGHLYRGVEHSHPEIGHHVIDNSGGPPCLCGFRGCWESLAAGPAMVTWMESNAPRDYPDRAGLTGKKVCELAQAGDKWAKLAVEYEGRNLGLGLANLITLFVPDAIALGGSVMKSAPLFMDAIRNTIASSCRFVPHEKTELRLASLGEETNIVGAASVWYHRFGSLGGARAV